MFLLRWTATDLLLMVIGAAVVVGGVVWLVPPTRLDRRKPFSAAEIRSYDRRLPAYFIVASVALVVGAAHTVIKNLPGFWTWLWEAGYGGHLFRDLANSHIVIVGGGTVLLTGLTWYALPRILGRPLYSEGLATVSLWLTVIGVFGFYIAWLVLGLVEGSMVRDGMTYAAAKESVGAWHRIPTRATASIMGVGYWTYVLNVVLTVWAARRSRSQPLRHLSKFIWVAALALFVGTVQGVLQVLPASADWIAAAGGYGEYIDPISHAHINLVTGMMVFLAGLVALVAPRLGTPVTRQDSDRVFWTLVPGSLAFYAAFLLIGLVGGGFIVGHGGIQNPWLVSNLLPRETLLIAGSGTVMLLGFWMYFLLVGRALSGRQRDPGIGPATFLAVSVGFLAVGTLHGLLQTLPDVAARLTVAEEIPNIHAQLNMIGGVILALVGAVYLLLPELAGQPARPALVRRSLVGIAGGIGSLYVVTLISGLVRGDAISSGASIAEAAARVAPVTSVAATFAAMLLGWGFTAFYQAIWVATDAYRAERRRARRAAPGRITGPMPTRLRTHSTRSAMLTEIAGGLLGWPGIGWLRAGQAIIGVALLLIGPAVAWALIPVIGAASSDSGGGVAIGRLIVIWILASTTLSAAGLFTHLASRARRERRTVDVEPPARKPPRGLVVGAIAVLLVLVSVPVIALTRSFPGTTESYPLLEEIPDRATGIYVDVTTPQGPRYLKLFAWSNPPDTVPASTPTVAADRISSLIAVQKGLDEFDRYRVFDLGTGSAVALDGGPLADGRTMTLIPRDSLVDGGYLIDIPIGGMFAGREYYFLTVGPNESRFTEPVIAASPADTPTVPPTETPWTSIVLVGAAAIAATLFAAQLWTRYARRRALHTAAYAGGMAMFALATWALYAALTGGWSPLTFRLFYLFGAVLNVPLLALGSVSLVLGEKRARISAAGLLAFALAAALVTFNAPFANPLPNTGIPAGSEIFDFPGPRLWAAIGSGVGATLLVALAVVSIARFRRTRPHLVRANVLIVAGTIAAAWGGTGLALGKASGFAVSLLVAATLIWLGDRAATTPAGEIAAGSPPAVRRRDRELVRPGR